MVSLSRFISNYTERCLPFFKALKAKDKFKWTQECQKAFEGLKHYLTSPPLLAQPQPNEPLYLYVAVSEQTIASVLTRVDGKQHQPVYYLSKKLQGPEFNYPKLGRLVLAIVHTARKLKQYFEAHKVTVLTGQPLKQIMQRTDTTGRLSKWAIELSALGVDYAPRPAIKAQVLADFMVECTFNTDDNTPEQYWELYVDGSSTKGGSGAGLVIITPDKIDIEYSLTFGFDASNNVSEYEALLSGLKMALKLGATKLKAYTDSMLVVEQYSDRYEVYNEVLAKYLQKLKVMATLFEYFSLTHIPRGQNSRADALSKLASTKGAKSGSSIKIENLKTPSIVEQEEINMIEARDDWATPIIEFLVDGILPEEPREANKIKVKATKYIMHNNILYKHSYLSPMLRCVRKGEETYVLDEIHAGLCGSHIGARALELKIRRIGFYWPTMRNDAQEHVQNAKIAKYLQTSSERNPKL